MTPLLDVVIAVHNPQRPISRAVRSLLDSAGSNDVRVTVVCHGVSIEAIQDAVGEAEGTRLRYLAFADGVPSPAGPFNFGMRAASAEYVTIMGSDDYVEEGALEAWTRYLRAELPDIALVPLRHQRGERLLNPMARPGRTRDLDAVRDRLFYRTAPLALIRREVLASTGAVLAEGLRTGDDIEMTARLWTSDVRIDLMRDLPCYVIGADAEDRVTLAPMPPSEQLAAVTDLLGSEWWASLPTRELISLGVKLLRIHVLDALLARPAVTDWDPAGMLVVSNVVRRIAETAPRAFAPLSVADRRLLDASMTSSSPEELVRAISSRRAASRWEVVRPTNLLKAADREAVPVRYLHYLLENWRRR